MCRVCNSLSRGIQNYRHRHRAEQRNKHAQNEGYEYGSKTQREPPPSQSLSQVYRPTSQPHGRGQTTQTLSGAWPRCESPRLFVFVCLSANWADDLTGSGVLLFMGPESPRRPGRQSDQLPSSDAETGAVDATPADVRSLHGVQHERLIRSVLGCVDDKPVTLDSVIREAHDIVGDRVNSRS